MAFIWLTKPEQCETHTHTHEKELEKVHWRSQNKSGMKEKHLRYTRKHNTNQSKTKQNKIKLQEKWKM